MGSAATTWRLFSCFWSMNQPSEKMHKQRGMAVCQEALCTKTGNNPYLACISLLTPHLNESALGKTSIGSYCSVRVTPDAKVSPSCSASKPLGRTGTGDCPLLQAGVVPAEMVTKVLRWEKQNRERWLKTTLHHVSSFSFCRNCHVPFMFSLLDQKIYLPHEKKYTWKRWRGFSDVICRNFLLYNSKSLVLPSYYYK